MLTEHSFKENQKFGKVTPGHDEKGKFHSGGANEIRSSSAYYTVLQLVPRHFSYDLDHVICFAPGGEETEAGGLVLVQQMCSLSIMKTSSVS